MAEHQQLLEESYGRLDMIATELEDRPVIRAALYAVSAKLEGAAVSGEEAKAERGASGGPLPTAAAGVAHLAEGLSRAEVLLVCELAMSRDRIEVDWDRLDTAEKDGGGEEEAEVKTREEIHSDTIDHQHRALLLISEGRVDPVAAAKAALQGSERGASR